MCGIFGYIGFREACPFLTKGIRALLNRGYDSVGIGTLDDSGLAAVTKMCAESIKNLGDPATARNHIGHRVGLAHSRWATHGEVNELNAHPHVSENKMIMIVHNGIIYNQATLKNILETEHRKLHVSETDSEVIANWLEYEYESAPMTMSAPHERMMCAIAKTIQKLEGTFGLAILCAKEPSRIYCVRKGSPILVAVTDTEGFVASEKSAFLDVSANIREYCSLKPREICVLTRNVLSGAIDMLVQFGGNKIRNPKVLLCDDQPQNQPNLPHDAVRDHWTMKEIQEQPDSISRAMGNGGRLHGSAEVKLGGLRELTKTHLMQVENVILLGCGSSFHAAQIGKRYFEELCNFNVISALDAGEFKAKDIPKIGKTVLLFLSQSGETRDLHNCIQIGKQNDCTLIGVINVVDSMIANEVDCGCYLNAGREVAVASTKSFTSQIVVLCLMAIHFSQNAFPKRSYIPRKQYLADAKSLSADVACALSISSAFASVCLQFFPGGTQGGSCFVLGQGSTARAVAEEGALKLKEISYLHAEGKSASSLKHGAFALLNEEFPVILLCLAGTPSKKVSSTFSELKSRHAKVMVICDTQEPFPGADAILRIPHNKTFREIIGTIPLQILSHKLGIVRGIDTDFPKNLAKVVTVE